MLPSIHTNASPSLPASLTISFNPMWHAKVLSKSGLLYNSKLSSTAELIVDRFPPQLMHCVCASAWSISGDVRKNVKLVPSYVNETSSTVVCVWAEENMLD